MSHGTHLFPALPDGNPGCFLVVGYAALWVYLLSSILPARAQDPQTFWPSKSLRGMVINTATREPVAHALVYSADNRLAMFSDAEGRFEFKAPPAEVGTISATAGTVGLMARKPGFLENQSSVFFLAPGEPTNEEMTIGLTPEALIVGRVNLPASNQFDRISVEVYQRQVQEGRAHWTSIATRLVRSSGEFRIADLRAGEYKLFTHELLDRDPLTFDPRGQLYGYPPVYYPNAADFSSGAPIHLEAGQTLQAELSPLLQPYYPVKITITGMQEPEQVQVSVALHGHRGPGYALGYDNRTNAITGMLPNGTYTVEARLLGQQDATVSAVITVKGGPVKEATMLLIPHGSVSVNIKAELDASNRNTASVTQGKFSREQNADVSLLPAEDFTLRSAVWLRPPRKPNDNALVLDNVGPGRYWVNIRPYGGYVASADDGGVDLLRHALVVGPGGSNPPINIVLRDDFANIDGSVEGMPPPASNLSDSSRVEGVTIYSGTSPSRPGVYVYGVPLPDSPGRFTETWISPEGSFHMQLPPGAYRVLAFDHRQELEYQNVEGMRAYEGKGLVVRLAPRQTEHVRVSLIAPVE